MILAPREACDSPRDGVRRPLLARDIVISSLKLEVEVRSSFDKSTATTLGEVYLLWGFALMRSELPPPTSCLTLLRRSRALDYRARSTDSTALQG